MVFLLLAVLAGSVKGFCGKKISGYAESVSACVRMNLWRMVLCCLIGLLLSLVTGAPLRPGSWVEAAIWLLSGFSTAVFLISWTLAVRTDAYMLVSACTTAAFLIPLLFGFFLFHESLGAKQIVGMLFIVAAVLLLVRYNNSIKTRLGIRQLLLLLLVFVSQGFVSVSQKLFTYYVPDGNNSVFNFYTFLFALVGLLLWQGGHRLRNPRERQKIPFGKVAGFLVVMAVMLFANSYFLTAATETVPAVILFPLNSVLSLAVGVLMSTVFFGERMTRYSVAGLLCTLISLLLTNL